MVASAGLMDSGEVGRLRVKWEEGFGDNHDGVFLILGPNGGQDLFKVLLIEVSIFEHVFGGCIGAFEEGVIHELIKHNVVPIPYHGLDCSKACQPACRVYQNFAFPELSNFLLELDIVPTSFLKYLVAPKARGLPAELTPKVVAPSMAASTVDACLDRPR